MQKILAHTLHKGLRNNYTSLPHQKYEAFVGYSLEYFFFNILDLIQLISNYFYNSLNS